MKHAGPISSAAFSPDGKALLTGSADRTARLWDAATGKPRGLSLTHEHPVSSVAFSPDGKRLLTCESGPNNTDTHWARLWDAATGRPLGAPLRCDNSPRVSAFSPDGRLVLVAGSRKVRCWRVADRQTVRAVSLDFKWAYGREISAALSPDGATLAVADLDTLRLWDPRSGRVLRRWPFPEPLRSLQFSPDGKTLLLCSLGRSAQLWDVALGRPKSAPLFHRDGKVRAAAFSPDSRVVVIGFDDGSALLWDAVTGKRLGPPLAHFKAVTAVAFRPDGRALVTGCADGTVLLWPAPEPEAGAVEAVRRRIEALTRLHLDGRGIVSRSDAAAGR
jgi:WD40 repeat protein